MKKLRSIIKEAVRPAILTSSGKEVPGDHEHAYNHSVAMANHIKTQLPHYTAADHREASEFHRKMGQKHLSDQNWNGMVRSNIQANAHGMAAQDLENQKA